MAEALLRQIGGDRFQVESAGIELGRLNPMAVEVLREVGIDISEKKPRGIAEIFSAGNVDFDWVITVCDRAARTCPFIPGEAQRLSWSFDEPSAFRGTWEEKLNLTRRVRDEIRSALNDWIGQLS